MTEYVTVWKDHEPTKLHWGVPVVRCKDCAKADWVAAIGYGSFACRIHGWTSDSVDGFCAWGERRVSLRNRLQDAEDARYDAGFENGMKATLQQLDGLIREGADVDEIQGWVDRQWEEEI